jgi:hypothetical protein
VSDTVRSWIVVASATAVGLTDISLVFLWLRPWAQRAWNSGGIMARTAVSVVSLLQLMLFAACALVIWLALLPFGGTCCV